MKKYICIGGYVNSKYDGQKHYINSRKLPELYHVKPKECVFIDYPRDDYRLVGLNIDDPIILKPRYNGNYRIEGE